MKFLTRFRHIVFGLALVTALTLTVFSSQTVLACTNPEEAIKNPACGVVMDNTDAVTTVGASDVRSTIQTVVQYLSFVIAAVSVLFIVAGGARWMNGDEKTGKEQIKNALIGIAIAIFAYLLATWIVGLLANVQDELYTS